MRFFDLDRWNEIWQTIHRNKKRSIMTALGVFWGVFMLVVLLGFGLGLGNFLMSNLGGLSTNTAYIFSNRTSIPYKGMPSGRWWELDSNDIKNIAEIDGVKYVAPIFWGRGITATYKEANGSYSIMGYHPSYQIIDPLAILKGRFINDIDMMQNRKVCAIGEQVETALFKGEDPIGKTIKVNNGYYMVIGVIKQRNTMMQMGSNPEESIIIPSSLYQQIYNMGDKINALAFTAEDNLDVDKINTECKKIISSAHIISPDDLKAVSGFSLAKEFKKINNILNGVLFLTWIVGLGTLFAGIVGVSNIMLVVVKERTQEIGIRRALGAKPSVIIEQILSESFILTFIAGIFGLACAVGMLSILEDTLGAGMSMNSQTGASFQITFGLGIICAAIIIAGSLIAGIIPATRALSIKAVDAIREE